MLKSPRSKANPLPSQSEKHSTSWQASAKPSTTHRRNSMAKEKDMLILAAEAIRLSNTVDAFLARLEATYPEFAAAMESPEAKALKDEADEALAYLVDDLAETAPVSR